jgi:hypothetical protein
VEVNGSLMVRRQPTWHDSSAESRLMFLQRIAMAGTRHLNRQLEIDFELILDEKRRGI